MYRSPISDKSLLTNCSSSESPLISEDEAILLFSISSIDFSASFCFPSISVIWFFALFNSSCSSSQCFKVSFFTVCIASLSVFSLSADSLSFFICLSASEIVNSTPHFASVNAMISFRSFSFSTWNASFVISISAIFTSNDFSSFASFELSSSARRKSSFKLSFSAWKFPLAFSRSELIFFMVSTLIFKFSSFFLASAKSFSMALFSFSKDLFCSPSLLTLALDSSSRMREALSSPSSSCHRFSDSWYCVKSFCSSPFASCKSAHSACRLLTNVSKSLFFFNSTSTLSSAVVAIETPLGAERKISA